MGLNVFVCHDYSGFCLHNYSLRELWIGQGQTALSLKLYSPTNMNMLYNNLQGIICWGGRGQSLLNNLDYLLQNPIVLTRINCAESETEAAIIKCLRSVSLISWRSSFLEHFWVRGRLGSPALPHMETTRQASRLSLSPLPTHSICSCAWLPGLNYLTSPGLLQDSPREQAHTANSVWDASDW